MLFALASLAGAAVCAHDFWIEPSAYRVATGAHLDVALRVGEGYRGDPVARNPAKIRRFVLVGPAGEQPTRRRRRAGPGGKRRDPRAGPVRDRVPQPPVVDHARSAEVRGVSAGGRPRARDRAARRAGTERAAGARDLLALRQGARRERPRRKEQADRKLGLPLELVAEANPYLGGSGPTAVRLLFRDRPLEGALVVALPKDAPEQSSRLVPTLLAAWCSSSARGERGS